MNIHQNARLTSLGRERLVRLAWSGLNPKAVAETMGVCPKTVGKWVARFEAEGAAGLQDRSSQPHRLHRPTAAATQGHRGLASAASDRRAAANATSRAQ